MERGGDVQIRGEAVVDDRDAAVGRHRGDLDGLGEAAAAGQVHLDDVDLADVHELEERLPLALLLAGRDPQRAGRGELGVAQVIVGQEGLLEPERVIRLEGPGALDGGLGVVDEPGVDHQVEVGAEPGAGLADQRDVGLGILAHGVPAELDRGEPLVGEPTRPIGRSRRASRRRASSRRPAATS